MKPEMRHKLAQLPFEEKIRKVGQLIRLSQEVKALKHGRGVLKRKPGGKPFRQSWAEYKKEEKALEEARYSRLRPR